MRRVVARRRSGRASYLDSSRHCSGWVREECVFFSDDVEFASGARVSRVEIRTCGDLPYINIRIGNTRSSLGFP
jgi:hypothetical protein